MIRLFLSPEQFTEDRAHIVGNDHQHLARVLRVRPGETVFLLDNAGNMFRAEVETVEKAETIARICERTEPPPEPPVFLTVAQALGKGDKFEQVLQHGTEAGASAFLPVRAERSVVDIPASRVVERVARWRQFA
jgi:16S rRNA (uracil1498-N3)-methyltransferase